MRIAGVASAFPKNYYPQEVIREALKRHWQGKLEKPPMGWDISEKGFRVVLSRHVPEMVRSHLAHDIDEFLGGYERTRNDIGT